MASEETRKPIGRKYTLVCRAYTNKKPEEFGISCIVSDWEKDKTEWPADHWIEQMVRACDKFAAENGALGWDGNLTECLAFSDLTYGKESQVSSFHRHMVWQDVNRGQG